MNFSQKLGLFILIVISTAYVYFSFFSAEGFHLPTRDDTPHDISELTPIDIPDDNIPSQSLLREFIGNSIFEF